MSQSHQETARRGVHGRLDVQHNAQRRPSRLHLESRAFQYPAQQTRQICRNRTPATVQQGKQKKSESSLSELDEPRPSLTKEWAEGGCPKDQTTGAETSRHRSPRPRLPTTQVLPIRGRLRFSIHWPQSRGRSDQTTTPNLSARRAQAGTLGRENVDYPYAGQRCQILTLSNHPPPNPYQTNT